LPQESDFRCKAVSAGVLKNESSVYWVIKKRKLMKNFYKMVVVLFFIWLSFVHLSNSFADTIVLASNNRTLDGAAIQTNDDDVFILTRFAAYNFSKNSIKEIKPQIAEAVTSSNTNRLPTFEKAILFLSQQPWATNLMPIASTVIEKGVMRHVPYTSIRCAENYEINVYGDLENPSGFEIGVYKNSRDDKAAKSNCVNFISSLLSQPTDRKILALLDLNQDLITRADMTFEITPPTAIDADNGWWISVYSEKGLNLARASDNDMQLISMTQADAEKDAARSTNEASWSADELKQARPASKTLISFTNTSGVWIENAELVRVMDGVSLIWRKGAGSGGMIKLADLPTDLQSEFGYYETKTKAADDLAQANKARWTQEVNAVAVAQRQSASSDSDGYGNFYSSDRYSGGSGRVYVHGYYRSNGTYVNSYTRSSPHRR
jgi:hypothetical protein